MEVEGRREGGYLSVMLKITPAVALWVGHLSKAQL